MTSSRTVLHDRVRMRAEPASMTEVRARVSGIMDDYVKYITIGGAVLLVLLVVGGYYLIKLADSWG